VKIYRLPLLVLFVLTFGLLCTPAMAQSTSLPALTETPADTTNQAPSVIIVDAPIDDTEAPPVDPAEDRVGRLTEYAFGAVIVVLSVLGLLRGSIVATRPLINALAGGYMLARATPDTRDDAKYKEVLAIADKWGVPTSEVMEVVNRWSGTAGKKSLAEVTELLTRLDVPYTTIERVGAEWDKKL